MRYNGTEPGATMEKWFCKIIIIIIINGIYNAHNHRNSNVLCAKEIAII